MSKVKSLADLRKIKENVQNKIELREKSDCGIASGAKELMDYMITELDKRRINAIVTQTGCMGYCYAEPTIEVTMPGQEPVVYGHVTNEKAEIMEKHLIRGELVDGVIPNNYQTIE